MGYFYSSVKNQYDAGLSHNGIWEITTSRYPKTNKFKQILTLRIGPSGQSTISKFDVNHQSDKLINTHSYNINPMELYKSSKEYEDSKYLLSDLLNIISGPLIV